MKRGWALGYDPGRSAADYDKLAATGATIVRFGLILTPVAGQYTTSLAARAELATQVAWAAQRGMTMVVTAHAGEDVFLGPLWTTPSLQASLLRHWQTLAGELLFYRNVHFDLLNEPQDQGSGNVWAALQPQIIEAVRAIDPDRRIVVSASPHCTPDSFAGLVPLPYPNLVYSLHMYQPFGYTHQGVSGNPQPVAFTPGQSATLLANVRAFQNTHGVDIYVGEFSVARWAPNRIDWLTGMVARFAEYGWDWTYHTWRAFDGWDAERNSDPADFTRRPTEPAYQLLLSGMVLATTISRAPLFRVADYLSALQALLPRGPVWPRDGDATLTKVLAGFTPSFERSNVAANNVITEGFPATSVQLLPEWESTLGLPGPFEPQAPTVSGRRAAVVNAFAVSGSLSATYYIGLIAALGINVTVRGFRTYSVNDGMDLDIASDEWGHTWQVDAPASVAVNYPRTADVVHPTPNFGNPLMDALLGALKPAHTICITRYT